MNAITITVKEVTCPNCGAGETHPADAHLPSYEQRLLIRGYKVCDEKGHWWSQCLVCSGYYDENLEPNQEAWKREEGWF